MARQGNGGRRLADLVALTCRAGRWAGAGCARWLARRSLARSPARTYAHCPATARTQTASQGQSGHNVLITPTKKPLHPSRKYHRPLKMAQRVTLRKRQPYNTSSNRRRVVKTPGGKLVVHHIKKLAVSVESPSRRSRWTGRGRRKEGSQGGAESCWRTSRTMLEDRLWTIAGDRRRLRFQGKETHDHTMIRAVMIVCRRLMLTL